jgi:uncharacterized protein DUF2637
MSSTDEATTVIRTAEQRATSSRFLGRVSLLPIAAAAVMGWSASFIGLHGFAQRQMTGFTADTAWLVPGAIDLSALGCTILVYRASVNGRSGFASRVLMYLFTALSAWVNWIHQAGGPARFVACVLPISAVVVFDRLAGEIRADWEADHGRKAFRLRLPLLILRYLVDRKGTREAFRQQITAIPVSALAGLGADLTEAAGRTSAPAPAPAPTPAPESGSAPAPAPAPESGSAPAPAPTPAPESGSTEIIPTHIPDWMTPVPDPRNGSADSINSAVPAPRTPGAGGADPRSEGVRRPERPRVIDVVRQAYQPSWDTGTIQRVVEEMIPGTNPETIKRHIRTVRTERIQESGQSKESGMGQYL